MKRRLLSVILAVVLILSMAVPTFALSKSGTIANNPWSCYASVTGTTASATTSYQGPTQCYTYIDVNAWCGQHTDTIMYAASKSASAKGNATAEVTDPVVTINGTSHICSPISGYMLGRVGSQVVVNYEYFS